MSSSLLVGDVRDRLASIDEGCVQTCITSPPYYALRDYGVEGQMGSEAEPDCLGWATGSPCGACYVCGMVQVFRDVRRVLRPDGTLWLNLGDSYAGQRAGGQGKNGQRADRRFTGVQKRGKVGRGIKRKDLIGVPWRVALALQADGWYLRSDVIWSKPNPMPESTKDRPAKSHEYLFLLAKGSSYYYDAAAALDPAKSAGRRIKMADGWATHAGGHGSFHRAGREKGAWNGVVQASHRRKRTVWTVSTRAYKDAHFATFPPDLIRPCVRIGAPPRGLVLDPFAGAGTTGVVCIQEGRDFLGIELNPEYAALAQRRIAQTQPRLL